MNGVPTGLTASVGFAILDSTTRVDGWWKYGPTAAPKYYPFGYEPSTGTGATTFPLDLSVLGLTPGVLLPITDGGRGDDGGRANGSITDPGATGTTTQRDPTSAAAT